MASEQTKTNEQTHFRTCNLCEAMCGIVIQHDGEKVLSIKGDKNDPFSKGYICPKATALQDLHEDPDRLRHPVERTANGWKEISWLEALDKVAAGIQSVQKKHGQNAFGIYLGNPNVHNLGGMLTIKHLLSSIKTRSRFSATSIDQLPHHIVSMHLFGHMLRIPVPDVNRTQYMLIIGGNPLASNGSIMTAPNMRQKLKDIKARDGKVVVIDPRRTKRQILRASIILSAQRRMSYSCLPCSMKSISKVMQTKHALKIIERRRSRQRLSALQTLPKIIAPNRLLILLALRQARLNDSSKSFVKLKARSVTDAWVSRCKSLAY